MQEKILVIEDEENIIDLIKLYLSNEGFQVEGVSDGGKALEAFELFKPSLIILDIMLPGVDGWEICREIRKSSPVPIIMLTAKETEVDKVLGLELGADDYITKPFSPRELIARVRAVLRRSQAPIEEKEKLQFQDLTIDLKRREVCRANEVITLTAKEFDLLKFLASSPGVVFSRDRLLEKVWGYEFYGDLRTVDVHIRHLREKLKDDVENPSFIETIWGVGYKFKGK